MDGTDAGCWDGSDWEGTREVAPNSLAAYRYMAAAFNRFQTSARRLWRYEYFRVVEEGSREPYRDRRGRVREGSERVHYHLIVMSRAFMPQKKLSELAARAGLGKILHIKGIRSKKKEARVVGYLASYATKDGGLSVPRRLRFFVMSQGWAASARATASAEMKAKREARRLAGWTFQFVPERDIPALVAADPTLASGFDLGWRHRYGLNEGRTGNAPSSRPESALRPAA